MILHRNSNKKLRQITAKKRLFAFVAFQFYPQSMFAFWIIEMLVGTMQIGVYYVLGSSSTTSTMATNGTSIPTTSVRAGSGFTFGDNLNKTGNITTPPVTETQD